MKLEKCEEGGGLDADVECPICGGELIVSSDDDSMLTDQTEHLVCPHCNETIEVSMCVDVTFETDVVGPSAFFEGDPAENESAADNESSVEDVGVPVN